MSLTLTSAQLTVLNAAAKADSNLTGSIAAKDTSAIAGYYNAPSSPSVMLWRNNVSAKDLVQSVDWSEYTTLTVQFQNSFQEMVNAAQSAGGGGIDATLSNLRSGFATIFSGKPNSLNALTAVAQVTGTKFETIAGFLSGSGPYVSQVFGYRLSAGDVASALFNPDGTVK